MARKFSETDFATGTLKDYHIYLALAKRESVPAFKKVLLELADTAKDQFAFWAKKSGMHNTVAHPSSVTVFSYALMRKLLGLTLTIKYIVGRTEKRAETYKTYCTECTVDDDFKVIDAFADRLRAITASVKEERVKFFSNVILGFNDALIELTGALVGFSFALGDARLISIAGLITGVSASMSMAASAYLQARHEKGRSPFKAASFTGVSYFVIALLLVAPFLVMGDVWPALGVMFAIILLLISIISFYSAVLLEKRYIAQLGEILLFSLGVAVVAFIIGRTLNVFIAS